MAHKTFTDDEIQKFKAAGAVKPHPMLPGVTVGDGRALQIDLEDPIFETVVVAPWTRATYADHYDRKAHDLQTSFHGALMSQLLYPGYAEIEALRQEWPVLPSDVADQLLEEAGFTADGIRVRRLDLADLPAGLDKAAAAQLMTSKPGARLWAVEVGPLSCVMSAPLADIWLAARSADGDARVARKGIIAATEGYVLGAVVWSREPVAVLLDQKPAIYWDLWVSYKRMGGDGAAVRRKSL